MLFGCKEFSLAEHLEPGAFTCRREFGLFRPFNGLDFNSSFHMLTNKCFVKFVAGQKRLGFASCWVFFEREVNFCFAESVDGCVVQPKDTAMALPRRPRAYQNLVVSTSSEILPSSEVMAINLPAPRGRACLHRTSRLSSRSFRGVRLQTRVVVVCTAGFGCHCLYQLFGVAALAHRGLPPVGGLCGKCHWLSPHRTYMP